MTDRAFRCRSRRPGIRTAALAALCCSVAFPGLSGSASASSRAATGPWVSVASPSPGVASNSLQGVTALSATDAWAVGLYGASFFGTSNPLAIHWNGTAWSLASPPAVSGDDTMLYGISGAATNDVWAVGAAVARGFGQSNVLIDHWNGSSWAAVPAPNPGSQWNDLSAVDAFASTNVWAVGYLKGGGDEEQPLIEHWDGTAWAVSPAPVPSPGGNRLQSVGGSSPTDVWAVGVMGTSTALQPLIEHWNGSTWSIVPAPATSSPNAVLSSVTSLSANDAWAVGDIDTGTHDQPLALHWDGTTWTRVALSTAYDARLFGVAPDGSGGAWAVGAAVTAIDESTPRQAPLFIDLTSSAPTVVLSSTTNDAGLAAVASTPGRLFAVGYREAGTAAGDPDPEKPSQTLVKQL